MTGEETFRTIVRSLLTDRDVTQAKMFGAPGLRVRGKVFATLYKGKLVLKLPSDRVRQLVATGHAELFDPGHGRVSREWVAVGESLTRKWAALVREAKQFVDVAAKS